MTTIFDPITLGDLQLSNRIIMAPLTRCRADEGRVPNALMAEYASLVGVSHRFQERPKHFKKCPKCRHKCRLLFFKKIQNTMMIVSVLLRFRFTEQKMMMERRCAVVVLARAHLN